MNDLEQKEDQQPWQNLLMDMILDQASQGYNLFQLHAQFRLQFDAGHL